MSQIIGANGQGLANAILFVGFTKSVRTRLWESARSLCWRLRSVAMSCCSKNSQDTSRTDYDQLYDENDKGIGEDDTDSTIVNDHGSKYGLADGELSVTTSLQEFQSRP